MRKGIVQGEPGIFPWPVGRFFHWISRKADPDGPASADPDGPATDQPAADQPATDQPADAVTTDLERPQP